MRLDPQIEAFLKQQAASGVPARSMMTVDQTREFARRTAALGRAPPTLEGVETLAVPVKVARMLEGATQRILQIRGIFDLGREALALPAEFLRENAVARGLP